MNGRSSVVMVCLESPILTIRARFLFLIFFGKVQLEQFQVFFRERCLAAHLAERITAGPGEPLGAQLAFVKPALAIAIGVDPGGLRKDIGADDRRISGNPFP